MKNLLLLFIAISFSASLKAQNYQSAPNTQAPFIDATKGLKLPLSDSSSWKYTTKDSVGSLLYDTTRGNVFVKTQAISKALAFVDPKLWDSIAVKNFAYTRMFPYADAILNGDRILTGKNYTYKFTIDSIDQFKVNTGGYNFDITDGQANIMTGSGAGLSLNLGSTYLSNNVSGSYSSVGLYGGDNTIFGSHGVGLYTAGNKSNLDVGPNYLSYSNNGYPRLYVDSIGNALIDISQSGLSYHAMTYGLSSSSYVLQSLSDNSATQINTNPGSVNMTLATPSTDYQLTEIKNAGTLSTNISNYVSGSGTYQQQSQQTLQLAPTTTPKIYSIGYKRSGGTLQDVFTVDTSGNIVMNGHGQGIAATAGSHFPIFSQVKDSLNTRVDTLFRRNDTVFVHNARTGTYYIPDNRNYVDVKWFGAVGDSVTNDRAAITAAVNYACSVNKSPYFSYGIYNIGNMASYDSAFLIKNVRGITIIGNGSKIVCNSTSTNADNQFAPPRIFEVSNAHNITFRDLRFQDNGYSDVATYKGAYGIYFPVLSGDITNITLENINAFRMLGLMYRAYNTNKFENIAVRNCVADRGYYGIILNNPKNLNISTFRTDSIKRALFLTGAQFVKADIWSYNHQAASAEILLKCYNVPLKNIQLRYRSDSSRSSGNAFVSLEQQTGIAPGGQYLIDNVDIEVDCSGSAVGYPVAIRSYDLGGTLETTTSKHWDNIRIRGLSAGVAGRQVQVFSTQDSLGLIEVDPMLEPSNFLVPYYPGFARKIGNTFNYTALGPLTTKTQFLDLSRFPGFPGRVGAVRLRAVMLDNTGAAGSANITYQEDVAFISISSVGVVTIISQANMQKKNTTTAATATYTASGKGINATFATYSNSASLAYITVEPIL